MAEYKNGGLDSKALAERKSKRLEEALSAFSPEQTKQTVSKLLEEYVDESGKNYFGAGTRDTTLYFADDEYIREIEKEKDHSKEEKISVVDKLHKLTSIIPKSEHKEDAAEEISEDSAKNTEDTNNETVQEYENEKAESSAAEEITADLETEENKSVETAAETVNENSDTAKATEESMPEPEPTIIITPVKAEDIKEQASTEEDTKEMRREFFDNEIEVDEVPRRRRKLAEVENETVLEEKNVPETDTEDMDDSDYDDDFEEDEKEKKNKFGSFFKRKKKDDPFDDEFDDEFDDDDYYDDDDDDYYDEGSFTFKKVLNVIVIIALICSTAFFAASNYTNTKKLESANTQINELNNGNGSNSDEQINELKAKVDELTAENERLKSSASTPSNTSEPQTAALSSNTGSTTISGTAPADENSSSTGSGTTYTIKAGDTGSKICNAVYGQYTEELWQKILAANGMTTSTVYHPGDVLQIP